MSAEVLTLNVSIIEKGKEIFSVLSDLMPETSLSFVLTEDGVQAVRLAPTLVEWGIGGNKAKLKETALECLGRMQQAEAGKPVNVNFTEYEVKAMGEVMAVFEKALEKQEGGLLAL